jgi:hypothetical protein
VLEGHVGLLVEAPMMNQELTERTVPPVPEDRVTLLNEAAEFISADQIPLQEELTPQVLAGRIQGNSLYAEAPHQGIGGG